MVRPFQNYPSRAKNPAAGLPCAICGKAVREDHPAWVRVRAGGSEFAPRGWSPSTPAEEAGDLGMHPVGSGCARRYRADLAPFIHAPSRED